MQSSFKIMQSHLFRWHQKAVSKHFLRQSLATGLEVAYGRWTMQSMLSTFGPWKKNWLNFSLCFSVLNTEMNKFGQAAADKHC